MILFFTIFFITLIPGIIIFEKIESYNRQKRLPLKPEV